MGATQQACRVAERVKSCKVMCGKINRSPSHWLWHYGSTVQWWMNGCIALRVSHSGQKQQVNRMQRVSVEKV